MYTANNRWDQAHAVAVQSMSEREVSRLYLVQAQRLESEGKLKEVCWVCVGRGEGSSCVCVCVFCLRQPVVCVFV